MYPLQANSTRVCRGTGVDCRAAETAPFGSGLGGGFDLPVIPIATIRGDRNNVDVTQE